MFGIVNYTGFLLSSIVLNLTPGADTIYVLSRAIAGGKRQGVVSALGISAGILVNTLLVAFGLAALIAGFPMGFEVIKWLGAGYLLYLGIRTLFFQKSLLSHSVAPRQGRQITAGVFVQGLLTNVLNPKIALFFLGFLPQFVTQSHGFGPLPFLLLGLSFCATSTIWSLALALGAGSLSGWLLKTPKVQNIMTKCSGAVYIGLGLHLLLTQLG